MTMEAHKVRERLPRVWGGPWWLRDHCALGLLRPRTQLLYLSCLFGSISLFHKAHSQDSMEVNHLLFRALFRTHTHAECNAKPSMVLRALTRAIFF